MEKILKIKHYGRNIYSINDCLIYDTEMYVYINSLSNNVNKTFGTNFYLNNRQQEIAEFYKGKKVYGNIHIPQMAYIKETWGDKWKLMTSYDFDDVKGCKRTFGDFTKDEIIEITKELVDFINTNDILQDGFNHLINHYGMKYICNRDKVAQNIIEHYGQFVKSK